MKCLIFLLLLVSLSCKSRELIKDFDWVSIKPTSIILSRGTTVLKSPVFAYSIQEKNKLQNRDEAMQREIIYLREQIRIKIALIKTTENHLNEIKLEHLEDVKGLEKLIKLQDRFLTQAAKMVEKSGKSDSNGFKSFLHFVSFYKILKIVK